ncbi:hypothetical protein N0V82_001965 [Gnomoniopsis sp. IMI 355080]|nr:hypothetical protein N0V82_001965 [Gnomoniopsis sp. IMI 355080]
MFEVGALLISPLLELWVLIAHLVLPASNVDGYVRDSKGKPLKYRLNGIPVLVLTVVVWAGLCKAGLLPWDYLYTHRWPTCFSACMVGLLYSAYLVAVAPPVTSSSLTDLFLGRTLNPRPRCSLPLPAVLGGGSFSRVLDIKMYLYLIGAVHLELNILSYAAAHYLLAHDPNSSSSNANPGVALAAALLSWFVVEYLYFENVHLFTYDLFAERVGFKLAWGCLCFYPFFYPIGFLAVVELPDPGRRASYYAFAAAVYLAGWGLSRAANLQKFWFKQVRSGKASNRSGDGSRGEASAREVAIRSADGKHELFCGGLWGVARHVNYVGEILEAVGIALAVGYPTSTLLPWLYPLYYVALLTARERDDDRRCREKYGALWEEYCRRVPYRLVPYVY